MRRCEPKRIRLFFTASALVNIPKWKVVNAEGGTKYGSAREPGVRTLHSRTSQFPTAIPFPTRSNNYKVHTITEPRDVVLFQLQSNVIVERKHRDGVAYAP